MRIQLGFGLDGGISVGLASELRRKIGTGAFGSAVNSEVEVAGNVNNSIAADFNGDGKEDLAYISDAGGQPLMLALGNGDGTFQTATTIAAAFGAPYLQAGDFNGDGRLDILGGAAAGASVVLGNGSGGFGSAITSAVGNVSGPVKVADLNGDGILDMAGIAAGATTAYVAFGQGNGSFVQAAQLSIGTGSGFGLAIGDFDGNGSKDIAITNVLTSGNLNVFLNNGSGSFGSRITQNVGTGGDLVAGDFNGDGKDDLAFAIGSVMTYESLGNGTFATGVNRGSLNGGRLIAKDMDRDGILDLVATSNSGGGRVGVIKGRGDGSFDSALILSTGNSSSYLTIGDFNQDGVPDILQVNGAGSSVDTYAAETSWSSTIEQFSLRSRESALAALSTIGTLMERLGRERGALGASQSRIFAALETLGSQRVNSDAAAGRIIDADVAIEAAEATRLGIVQRAATAVLAQVNQAPALALTLLRN